MNLYAQAIAQNKRDAQSRSVTMVLDDNHLHKAQLNGPSSILKEDLSA